MKLKSYLVKIFKSKKIKINKKDYTANFFEKNILDSIQFLNLISEIEKDLKITFRNKDFRSNKFFTINNLSKLVNKKINDKKKRYFKPD